MLPEVLAFYAEEPGLRDRELKLIGLALGAAAPDRIGCHRCRARRSVRSGRSCGELGLRPRLRSLGFDEASLDVVAADALADAAINNSPRMPTLEQARAILVSVLG